MRKHDVATPGSHDAEHFPSFFAPTPSLAELAQEQGIKAVQDVHSLRADFWPESDSLEELAATVRAWRGEAD